MLIWRVWKTILSAIYYSYVRRCVCDNCNCKVLFEVIVSRISWWFVKLQTGSYTRGKIGIRYENLPYKSNECIGVSIENKRTYLKTFWFIAKTLIIYLQFNCFKKIQKFLFIKPIYNSTQLHFLWYSGGAAPKSWRLK